MMICSLSSRRSLIMLGTYSTTSTKKTENSSDQPSVSGSKWPWENRNPEEVSNQGEELYFHRIRSGVAYNINLLVLGQHDYVAPATPLRNREIYRRLALIPQTSK